MNDCELKEFGFQFVKLIKGNGMAPLKENTFAAMCAAHTHSRHMFREKKITEVNAIICVTTDSTF